MLGLSTLGIVHTIIGLLGLSSGIYTLARHKEISFNNRCGQFYLITTLITAATSLGIFQRGGFGVPHVFALMTLGALAVGTIAALLPTFGRASRIVQAVSFTSTILFHLIPGAVETLTRIPVGNPIAASPEAPILQKILLGLLVAYAIGLFLQIRWIRAAAHRQAATTQALS